MISEIGDAILTGNCDKIDALISAGMDANTITPSEKWNFLHKALVTVTRAPNPGVIAHLIALGVDVNAKDQRLWTPLHFAARTKSVEAVKLLVDAGAELDVVNDEGVTPLHKSLVGRPRDLAVAEFLLAAGANPDFDGGSGTTARKFATAIANPDRDVILSLFSKYSDKLRSRRVGN